MIEIPLTRGKLAIVDDEFAHLANWKWGAQKNGNTYYATHSFKKDDGRWAVMFMHHAIIGQPLNRKLNVDHVNGNGLLNSRRNLRHLTHRENMSNQKVRRDGKTSSQYVGVTWNKSMQKWKAQIKINGKYKYLGYFKTELEAHLVYLEKLKEVDPLSCQQHILLGQKGEK